MKLNVDGSSLGNPGCSGAGGVIKDHSGKLIRYFAEHIGFGSSNYAEGMELLLGLQIVKSLNLVNVDIELDSMIFFPTGAESSLWSMVF